MPHVPGTIATEIGLLKALNRFGVVSVPFVFSLLNVLLFRLHDLTQKRKYVPERQRNQWDNPYGAGGTSESKATVASR